MNSQKTFYHGKYKVSEMRNAANIECGTKVPAHLSSHPDPQLGSTWSYQHWRIESDLGPLSSPEHLLENKSGSRIVYQSLNFDLRRLCICQFGASVPKGFESVHEHGWIVDLPGHGHAKYSNVTADDAFAVRGKLVCWSTGGITVRPASPRSALDTVVRRHWQKTRNHDFIRNSLNYRKTHN